MDFIRPQATEEEIEEVLLLLKSDLDRRVKQHGRGIFISPHEIRGVLEEEVNEHLDEVKANNISKQLDELLDVAVVAIWGVASILKWSRENV